MSFLVLLIRTSVRQQGETYRDRLMARVRELGIENHVVFFNQFVDQATLLDFISMCDVSTTPYLNEAQMTSGTLAFSFGLGKAVVSTPYWHAKELLNDGLGILVPFADAKALGDEIAGLLTNDVRRHAMRKRAYAASRSMTWVQTAKRYLAVFETESENARPGISLPIDAIASGRNRHGIPQISRSGTCFLSCRLACRPAATRGSLSARSVSWLLCRR